MAAAAGVDGPCGMISSQAATALTHAVFDYNICGQYGRHVTLSPITSARMASDTLETIEFLTFADGTVDIVSAAVPTVINGTAGDDIINGTSGNDQINGFAGEDVLFGDDGNDVINGGGGEDIIEGGAGADTLNGTGLNADPALDPVNTLSYESSDDGVTVNLLTGEASGGHAEGDTFVNFNNLLGSDFNDVLTLATAGTAEGGAGVDIVTGSEENDIIAGEDFVGFNTGADNDQLFGLGGDDFLEGGGGADFIDGGDGIDGAVYVVSLDGVDIDLLAGTAFGGDAEGDTLVNIENLFGSFFAGDILRGDGNDNFFDGFDGDDVLDGRDGNDTLRGGNGIDILIGGNGDDELDGGAGDDTLSGDAGTDILLGDVGDDNLSGGTGNDELRGGDGLDTLNGDAGNDRLFGDVGADELNGGAGVDRLFGGDDDDILRGGTGNDTLYGEAGNDVMSGGAGDDFVFGGDGNDVVVGATGNDRLYGQDGDDNINGNDGNDFLRAGTGNDILRGSAGDDRLFGDQGDDILSGGEGADVLTGGAGADSFAYDLGSGLDAIRDFGFGDDTILVDGALGVSSFDDLQIVQRGTSALVRLEPGGEDALFLFNTDATSLTADDFLFEGTGTTSTAPEEVIFLAADPSDAEVTAEAPAFDLESFHDAIAVPVIDEADLFI